MSIAGIQSDFNVLREHFNHASVAFRRLNYYALEYAEADGHGDPDHLALPSLQVNSLLYVDPMKNSEIQRVSFTTTLARGRGYLYHGICKDYRESYHICEACSELGRLALKAGEVLKNIPPSVAEIANIADLHFDDQRWLLAVRDILETKGRLYKDNSGFKYTSYEVKDIFIASSMACGRICTYLGNSHSAANTRPQLRIADVAEHEEQESALTGSGKNPGKLPDNKDVLDLCGLLSKNAKRGAKAKSEIDVAREHCRGNETKAQNLLRQARRFPHLWKPR